MTLQLLIDRPEFFPLVAQWNWDEWQGLLLQKSAAEFEHWLRARLRRDALPTTLLALERGVPVGTVSLLGDDMETRPDLSPWLASLYVLPAQRGRGLGRKLVQAAVAEAQRLGLERLYLYTPGQESFYAALDWQILEHGTFQGQPVTIMHRSLREKMVPGGRIELPNHCKPSVNRFLLW